jgi:CRP-like cAMP-binding protein
MPKIMQFNAGKVVYVEGEIDERIFIFQDGEVNITALNIETGKLVREVLQKGEFFGIKSALGKYPRDETVQIMSDSILIVLTVQEFEAIALANPHIIMRMLKVYSGQLRKISRLLSTLKIQSHARWHTKMSDAKAPQHEKVRYEKTPEESFFGIGKYYLDKGKSNEAKYVFGKYLHDYPAGKYASDARAHLAALEHKK